MLFLRKKLLFRKKVVFLQRQIKKESIMRCNHCGADTPDDSIYCEQCGKKLDLGGKRPSTKMLIWLGVAALAIVAVVLVFALSGNSSAGDDKKEVVKPQDGIEKANSQDGIETAENTIIPGDGDAVKAAKMMDQFIRVIEREPNATNYRKGLELSLEIEKYNYDRDAVYSALVIINPDIPNEEAFNRKWESLSGKWNDWVDIHQEEAKRIREEVYSRFRRS